MAQKFVARLPDDLKAQLAALADSEGISQNALVVKALQRYVMAPDSTMPSGASEVMADVIARLEKLEAIVGMVQRDRPGASEPPSIVPPELEGNGLSQAQALKAAGYSGNVANAKRDLGYQDTTPQEWLSDRGWEYRGNRWWPPARGID